MKLQGANAIVVACLGDGATEQGVFWESLNFASLHSLPILWVMENNGLSVHAPLGDRQCAPVLTRVAAFKVRVFRGSEGLRSALRTRGAGLPAFVDVPCERKCAHVSAMEDLRV